MLFREIKEAFPGESASVGLQYTELLPKLAQAYVQKTYGLGTRWAHRIVSYELEGRDARLHVIQAADKKAKMRSKTARRDLMLVERAGACIAWGGALDLAPADDVLITVERPMEIDTEAQMVASLLAK